MIESLKVILTWLVLFPLAYIYVVESSSGNVVMWSIVKTLQMLYSYIE